jgi:catechol 2,3-dioxygenase-like lactoylglutathione lyase family enzyme
MPLAHVSLPVSSLEDSTAFYSALLAPLNYDIFMKLEHTVGFTIKYAGPDLWLHQCPEGKGGKGEVSKTHVAFVGTSKKAVEEFWKAGL